MVTDDSDNIAPVEKNPTTLSKKKKKGIAMPRQQIIHSEDQDILKKNEEAKKLGIISSGSILNQKLNLSAFGSMRQFSGYGAPVLPQGFNILGNRQPPGLPQNVPVIEDEIFSGFSARPRNQGLMPSHNINPSLNKMHDQQI